MRLAWIEYRKLWNKASIVALIALLVIATLHTFVYLNLQYRTLDSNGNIWTGLKSFRILLEESRDIEGVMDGEYIDNLVNKFNASKEKEYLESNRGFLGTAGMTKYMFPNYTINFAYYGPYMTNGNDKVMLDYDFLSSEDAFYEKYLEAVEEKNLTDTLVDAFSGGSLSDGQAAILHDKIQEIHTPFAVGYNQWFPNINGFYIRERVFFLVMLMLALCGSYSKKSSHGVSELTLATAKGRGEDFAARWIAGNCFAVTFYVVYVAVLILEHGAIASLHGWNNPIRATLEFSIYNFSNGTCLLLIMLGGLLGALVFANLSMAASAISRSGKISILISMAVLYFFANYVADYGISLFLNPVRYYDSHLVVEGAFLGNALVPCLCVVAVISFVYVGLLFLLIKASTKRYHV